MSTEQVGPKCRSLAYYRGRFLGHTIVRRAQDSGSPHNDVGQLLANCGMNPRDTTRAGIAMLLGAEDALADAGSYDLSAAIADAIGGQGARHRVSVYAMIASATGRTSQAARIRERIFAPQDDE